MPFLLLMLLSLAHMQPQWDKPAWLDLGPLGCTLATWGGILMLWIAAFLGAVHFRQRVLQEPDRRSYWMRRFAVWKRYHFIALLGFYLAALYLGWGWTIKENLMLSQWAQPGVELVLLAPMFMGLVASWTHFYDLERAAHQVALFPDHHPFLGRWTYVTLQARHNLLLIVPALFVMILQRLFFAFFPALEDDSTVTLCLAIALLLATFISIPLLLRWFLGLKSLPAGPLRDRLEGRARALHFRYSDILLWNTRSTVANAMVTGVMPWMRYVIVSDRLVECLTVDEVEAVFGHEVGHIKHHHMSFYMLFLMTSLIGLGMFWFGLYSLGNWLFSEAEAWTDFFQFHSVMPQLALFAVYMVMVFGFLSRRCERQADIFGCRTVSTQAFISALEKVADLNGMSRDNPGWLATWQHGSIGQRIAFLQRMEAEPSIERNFQRRLAIFKWSFAACLVGLTIVGFSVLGIEGVSDILRSDTHPRASTERI